MQGKHTLSGSNRFSATSHKYTISAAQFVLQLSMLLLCVGAVRAGHKSFTINWIYLLLLLNVLLVLTSRRINLRIMELLPFVMICAIEIPLQWLIGEYFGWRSALSGFIVLAMTVVLVAQLTRQGYEKKLWNVLNAVSIFSTICICMQTAGYLVGIRLDKIPVINELFFKAWEFSASFRPCATFSEPSHYAEIVLLSLFYYLFVEQNKKLSLFLTCGLCLSTSGLGIIGAGLLLVFYLLNLDRFSRIKPLTKYTVVTLTFVMGVGALIWAQSTSLWIIQRIMSGGTSAARIWRSFDLFQIMDLAEKIFGIGIQNQMLYLNHYSITLAHDTYDTMVNREFAQTLGYILCTTGISGFLAFVFPFGKMILKQNYCMKALCLLFLFICFTCCIFSRHVFAIYLTMIYATAGMLRASHSTQETKS